MSTFTPNFNIEVPTPDTPWNKIGAELLAFGLSVDQILKTFDYNGANPDLVLTRVAQLEAWRTQTQAKLTDLENKQAALRGTEAQRASTIPKPGQTWRDSNGSQRLWSVGPDGKWRRQEGLVVVSGISFAQVSPVFYASPTLTIPTVIGAAERIELSVIAASDAAFLTVNTSHDPTRNSTNTVVTARLTRLAAGAAVSVTFGWRVATLVA